MTDGGNGEMTSDGISDQASYMYMLLRGRKSWRF
jgi:hypothetical protein